MAEPDGAQTASTRSRRSDAQANVRRIKRAATHLLPLEPEATIAQIAAAAEVSRATVYRHFATRRDLVKAVRAELDGADPKLDLTQADGELASAAAPSLLDAFNKVAPHRLGEQIVAEGERLAGGNAVALYVVDIEGMVLLRLAGSQEFPYELPAPLAVGPELPLEGLPALHAAVAQELPGSVLTPLVLRGRALGALLAVNAPEAPLRDLASHAAAALELADAYTDVVGAARRRRKTTAAAEIQQNLLPPRIARIAGGTLAGNVLPGYDVGGDWFDYAENADGAWIGVADSRGSGITAAAIGAVSLGAFRAERQAGSTLKEAAQAVHKAVEALEVDGAFVNAVLGRWHGPSSTFRWITCAHQPPLLLTARGELQQLAGVAHGSLGMDEAAPYTVESRRLDVGDRLLLLSDGVLERRTHRGKPFGLRGVRAAVARSAPGAPATVRAIEDAISTASADPLEDDATIVVFAPTAPAD